MFNDAFLLSRRRRSRTFLAFLCLVCSVPCITAFAPYRPDSHKTSASLVSLSGSTSSYIATCIPGLSSVLAKELNQLGCEHVEPTGDSAVKFTAHLPVALSTVLYARTAHKIMEFLCQGSAIRDREDLAAFVRDNIDVKQLLGDGQGGLLTVSVRTMLNNPQHIPSDINHSHYSALTIKNALCDVVRELRGDRPSVDLEDPDVPLTAVLVGNAATQSADISLYRQLHAGTLHRRGYRQNSAIHKAAMKESLAAGLLLFSGWDKKCQSDEPVVLLDPMAGSGTFLLEAAMIAADIAPGIMRIKCRLPSQQEPCILRWKHEASDGDIRSIWKQLLIEASERAKQGMSQLQRSKKVRIMGNERHPGAIELMDQATEQAGMLTVIDRRHGNCHDWRPLSDDPSLSSAYWFIATNPPWGERLTDEINESWNDLRIFFRQNCPSGTEAWVLSGNAAATKHLGLRKSQSLSLKTGTQSLRWLQYMILDQAEKRQLQPIQPPPDDEEWKIRLNSSRKVQGKQFRRKQKSYAKEQKKQANDWLS